MRSTDHSAPPAEAGDETPLEDQRRDDERYDDDRAGRHLGDERLSKPYMPVNVQMAMRSGAHLLSFTTVCGMVVVGAVVNAVVGAVSSAMRTSFHAG